MKRTIAAILSILLSLSLCACRGGGGGADDALPGTYTLYAMDYDEDHIVLTDQLFEGENYITLKSGGTGELCFEDETDSITWKADGGKLTITASDEIFDATVKDGILALNVDDGNMYFVGEGGKKESLKAISLDEFIYGEAQDIINGTDTEPTAAEVQSGPSELQQLWNGWYFGCIDMSGCTGAWEFLNGGTFDANLYVELDRDGVGRLAIYDPFGSVVYNEHNNIYVDAACHGDSQYLYVDSGSAFGCEMNTSDWRFVRNLADPDKLNVGSTSTNDSGETIGYDFQFKPWGDRWEGDDYAQFIPYFSSYIAALDAGLASPFGDTFPGFGIAEPAASQNGGGTASDPVVSGGDSALLGANPAQLDINDRGIARVYYPADQFQYDDWYGKLKNEATGVGILLDPMLGATNFEELKASYQQNNSDEQDYSLVETTVNGYKALVLKYSDWLGSTMRVDIDFGGNHDGWYGLSFAVSGDSLGDCDTPLVWAIIESMELLK